MIDSSHVGRVLMGLPFVWLGYEAAAEPGGRVDMAADLGVPQPEMAVRFNGAAMAVGGTALALGVVPKWAALGLVASLLPTTLAGHPFWRGDDPAASKANRIQALKNLSIAGGLLAIAAAARQPR
jgi:putative oxidoreductase